MPADYPLAGPVGPPGPAGPALAGGTRRYLACAGVNTGYTTPDDASLDITGLIDLQVLVTPTSWASGTAQYLLGKFNTGSNQRSYGMLISSTGGHLQFQFSTDGTGTNTITLTSGVDIRALLVGARAVWVRALATPNDGTGKSSVTFSYRYDRDFSWTVIDTKTSATPGPWFSGSAKVAVGQTDNGVTPFTGRVYEAKIWNGDSTAGGTLKAFFDARGAATPPATFTDTAGRVWTPLASAALFMDEVSDFDFLDETLSVQRLVPSVSPGDLLISTVLGPRWGGAGGAIDATAFGADPTGVSDSTAAIIAALAAATPSVYGTNYETGARSVFFPPGIYLISSLIQVPNHVDVIGAGRRLTAFKCTAAGAGFVWGFNTAPYGGTGHRGGENGHFIIDGNAVATQPMKIANTNQRTFMCIDVTGSAGDALYVVGAQNCLFLHIVIEKNAGNGLVLDGHTAGHTFERLELANNGSLGGTPSDRAAHYNLKIWHTGATSGASAPSDIVFSHCILEEWGIWGAAGNVYIGSGSNIDFVNTGIHATDVSGTQRAAITHRFDNLNGAVASNNIRFTSCRNLGAKSGAGTGSVWYDATGTAAVTAYFLGRNRIQSNDIVWRLDDTVRVFADAGSIIMGSTEYDAQFVNQAGGAKTYPECVRMMSNPAMIQGAATDALLSAFWPSRAAQDGDWAQDVTNHHLYHRINGTWVMLV